MMKRLPVLIALVLLQIVFLTSHVYAANTTMRFSPDTGSFDHEFSTELVIDGKGDAFNAAGATVQIPSNLAVKDLVVGDCGFSFTTTPSTEDPSFEGVSLGASVKACRLYTLTLIPTKKGEATISLSHATVRRYGDAAEILSSTQNGKYTLTGVLSASVSGTKQVESGDKDVYGVTLTILSPDGKVPVQHITVTLDTAAHDAPQYQQTDENGSAVFANLKPGIYVATIKQPNGQTQESILNVSGRNHMIHLSLKVDPEQSSSPMSTSSSTSIQPSIPNRYVLGVGIAAIVIATVVFLKRKAILRR